MIWWILLPVFGELFAGVLEWRPVRGLFELSDLREERQITRGNRSASYAFRIVGSWWGTGAFLAHQGQAPAWWPKTVADAIAELEAP